MDRRLLISVIAALCVAAGLQVSVAERVLVPAQADATLVLGQPGNPLGNGRGEFLFVGFEGGSGLARGAIRFAVEEAVPVGSRITSAELRLTVALGFGNVALFSLASTWNEGPTAPDGKLIADDAREGDVTWTDRYFSRDAEERLPWEDPGGDLASESPVAVAVSGSNGSYVFGGDSFAMEVQRAAARPDLNRGWLLIGNEGSANSLVCFVSREGEDLDLRPVLVIDYEPVSDLERMTLSFQELETIGGLGEEPDQKNYWKPRYEGKPALEAELSRPNASAADRWGRVYFSDTYAHAVRRIDPDGRVHTVAGLNERGYDGDGPALERHMNTPMGIYPLRNGTVYFVDQANGLVRKIDVDGMLTTVVTDVDGIVGGRGLWVSEDESELYYGDQTAIRRWRRDAPDVIENFATGFRNVAHFDVDDDGDGIRMLAADMDRNQVYLVEADGTKRAIAGGDGFGSNLPARDTRLEEPRSAIWLGDGAYLIATQEDGRIWYVGSDAIARVLLEGAGTGNVRNGDGDTLTELYEAQTRVMSQCYDLRLTPNGSLLLTTNDTGIIRIVHKTPAPAQLSIEPGAEGGMRLTWPARPAVTYVIETSADQVAWTRSFLVTANAQSMSYTDTSTLPSRFYRVGVYP